MERILELNCVGECSRQREGPSNTATMIGMDECGVRIACGGPSSAAFGDRGHSHEPWPLPLMDWVSMSGWFRQWAATPADPGGTCVRSGQMTGFLTSEICTFT